MGRRTIRAAVVWSAALAPLCPPAVGQSAGGNSSSLGQQIAALVNEPAVSRAHWGVMVTALDGIPIYGLNEAQFFQPASNAKLYTTAAALALLGPERTFETRVTASRRLDPKSPYAGLDANISPTLDGDLVLIGGGDANLSARRLPYESPSQRSARLDGGLAPPPLDPLRYLADLADQVAATGLKTVTGDVVGDDTQFPWEPYAENWSIDDMVWGYGAPVSALSINDNQIQVTVAPGAAQGKPTVTLVPALPYYTLEVSRLVTASAGAGSHIQMDRAPGSKVLHIFGWIAVDAPADVEEVAIADPAEYAATALKGMLEARGIEVRGKAVPRHWVLGDPDSFLDQMHQVNLPVYPRGAVYCQRNRARPGPEETVIATHRSVALAEDVVVTNKVSQNLHAEMLLHNIGDSLTCIGSTALGARAIREFLLHAGIDKDDFVFYDGSGLSGHDLVTPRATAKLLHYATTQPWGAAWKASLPVGGEDSGLAARFAKAPLKDHVFAKTGTLGEARALSGYLDCASGRTVIFSIMVSTHMPGGTADRDAMDRIVAAIQAAE